MKEYILKGDPKELDKVLRENRIRISRGVISITPAKPDATLDEYAIKTLQESHSALGEERVRLIAQQNKLAELTGLVVSLAVAGGQTIPEDVTANLTDFGIIVPKIGETAESTAEIGENLTESVPSSTETANMEPEPGTMDNKHIEVEAMQEVNPDADDKTPVNDDTKDLQEDDSKEAASATKTSKRSKKSE